METAHYHSVFYSSAAFVVVVLLLGPAVATAAKEKCNPQDKKVLLGIKNYYHNAPVFSSWTASSDCCTQWRMVKCDATTHRITSLSVGPSNGLSGAIAPAVGDLPYLTSLEFHNLPNITGPIPNSIANLHSLTYLGLYRNSLTGPIPDFFHTLKKVTTIDLSFNKLSGSIPPSIGLTPSLGSLFLDGNQLTGSIPDTFGTYKSSGLYTLRLSRNRLSGPIPRSLGRINITQTLDLSRNRLTGDATFLFGESKTVSIIDLSRNQLAFNMSNIGIPFLSQAILVEHNKIYGNLPSSFDYLDGLLFSDFNVSYNMLCGRIPDGGSLRKFDKYAFAHNKCLCGGPLAPCK